MKKPEEKPALPTDLEEAKELAKRKLNKVISRWFTEDAMLMSAWCIADKVVDSRQKTIGIDSRSNPPIIRYNPFFINMLNQEQLECIIASECFKILLRHPTTRLLQPRMISSLASQITIDQCIMGNLLNINDYFPAPVNFGVEPNRYFEEYFRKLMENLPETISQVNQMFQDSKKENKDEHGQGQPRRGKGEQQKRKGQEQDEGQTQGEQTDGNGFTQFQNPNDAMKNYFDPRGTSNQDWDKNDLMDADVNNMIKEKKNSAKDWGKYTGDAKGDIVAANTPKISYREITRRFALSVLSSISESSRMKISRRYDLDAPGYRRKYKSKIIFAVDASGSISDEDLKEGFAVINSVCRHSEIEFILFDTKIKLIEKKINKAKKLFKVAGRGGTDFNEVMQYAEKHKKDGLVVFTDGQAPAPVKPKNTKVLWLMTNKEYRPPVEWGFRACLNRYENSH